jgi:two-component system sensor histidine kinase SenX3
VVEELTRRPDRTPARVAAEVLDALRVGVLVLDAADQPVMANPAAVDLGLTRGADQVHPVIRTLAGQVRRSGVRREVELDLPRGAGRQLTGEPLACMYG